MPLVYKELRQLAPAKMAHEAPGQTLQPTGWSETGFAGGIGWGLGERTEENQDRLLSPPASEKAFGLHNRPRRVVIDVARRRPVFLKSVFGMGFFYRNESRPPGFTILDASSFPLPTHRNLLACRPRVADLRRV